MMVVAASHSRRIALRASVTHRQERVYGPVVIVSLGRGDAAAPRADQCDLSTWWPEDTNSLHCEAFVGATAQSQAELIEATGYVFGGNDKALFGLEVSARQPVQDKRQNGNDQRKERRPVAKLHRILPSRLHQTMALAHLQDRGAA